MIIGAPAEIKSGENKIALTPALAKSLIDCGHKVIAQKKLGINAGFVDDDYISCGVELVSSPQEVYDSSDIIVKINQPQVSEYELLKDRQIIFAFFNYTDREDLMQTIIDKKITTINYSGIKNSNGNYPITTLGSEIVGKTLIRIASSIMSNYYGGALLGGATGVEPTKITIIGAGIAGYNAAKTAVAIGSDVTVLDINPEKLRNIENLPGRKIKTLFSNRNNIEKILPSTDVLICTAKRSDKKLPPVIKADDLKLMKKGAIIIDAGLASGNVIVETIDRVLTVDNPVYEKDGIIHYCVSDIASTAAKTISSALSGVLYPYIISTAGNSDIIDSFKECRELIQGVITYDGHITDEKTAELFGEHVYELSMLTGF